MKQTALVLLILIICTPAFGKTFRCNLKDMISGEILFDESVEMIEESDLYSFVLLETDEIQISAIATFELVGIQSIVRDVQNTNFGHLGLGSAVFDNSESRKSYYALCEIK